MPVMCKSKGELSYQVQNYKTIKWHWEEIAHRRFTADFRRNLFAQRLKTFTERGIAVTKLYEILSKKVGKEEAEALTVFVEEKIVDEFEKNKSSIVNEVLLDNEKPGTAMAQLRTEVHQSLRKSVVGNYSLIFPAVLYNNLFDPEYD